MAIRVRLGGICLFARHAALDKVFAVAFKMEAELSMHLAFQS